MFLNFLRKPPFIKGFIFLIARNSLPTEPLLKLIFSVLLTPPVNIAGAYRI
jgi:hypothetical protein